MSVKLSNPTSRLLDVLRGVAALLVVAGHSREVAARMYDLNPTGTSFVEKLFLVPSSFAMESVAVFFVLSGFLVGGQIIRENNNSKFTWAEFLAKRLSRLWTVLIPGLIFTWLLWDAAFRESRIHGFGDKPSLSDGLCNAFYLQDSWCAPFSNNSSLWSLSYEFWFYVVFAGCVVAINNTFRGRVKHALLNLGIVFLSISLFGVHLLLLMPGWLIGAALSWYSGRPNRVSKATSSHPYLWVAFSVVLITSCAVISNFMHLHRAALTVLISIPSALFVMFSLSVKNEPKIIQPAVNVGVKFGHWSFSIYVFHLPIVVAVLYLMRNIGLGSGLNLPVLTYLTMVISVPFTLVLWHLTERNTPFIRKISLKAVSKGKEILYCGETDSDAAPQEQE